MTPFASLILQETIRYFATWIILVFVLTSLLKVILFVAKSKGSLIRLEYPKPRYDQPLSH